MYQLKDVFREIEIAFRESESDIVEKLKKDCSQLLNISISEAANIVNQWIIIYKDNGYIVADYPDWLKMMVWLLIYNEMLRNLNAKQTNMIEDNFFLPKDVFKEKYWNMYSPDMKIRQAKYDNLLLPFHYAQVECDPIYRAMLHHMVCGADVLTDTIVDVFGKMGLIPALCAKGYKNKVVCLNEQDYKILTKVQLVLRNRRVAVYKHIQKVQKFLVSADIMREKKKFQEF